MKATAFIPARWLSTRFPGKNVTELGGLPLVACAVKVANEARELGLVGLVVVSTDDVRVRDEADRGGQVEIAWRPESIRGQDVTVVEVLRAWLAAADDPPALVCLLLPTSPLRTLRHLVESRALMEPQVDVVMSVTPFRQEPFHALLIGPDDAVEVSGVPDDRPRWRHDGTVIWVRSAHVRVRSVYEGNVRAYRVPPEESADINTPLDLRWAEFLATPPP